MKDNSITSRYLFLNIVLTDFSLFLSFSLSFLRVTDQKLGSAAVATAALAAAAGAAVWLVEISVSRSKKPQMRQLFLLDHKLISTLARKLPFQTNSTGFKSSIKRAENRYICVRIINLMTWHTTGYWDKFVAQKVEDSAIHPVKNMPAALREH